MSFPRYPKYKDSGVEWLGQVPEHWDFARGRRVFTQKRDPALPADEQLSATQKYGVIPQRLFMVREEQKVTLALSGIENFKHVQAGDFVISLRSFQGGLEYSAYAGCVSPAYTVLRARDSVHGRYWAYAFKSAGYIAELQSITEGIRDGKNISYEQFGEILLPLVPLCEQRLIADFLDREISKIDTLVAEQRRLIELLKERRQAIISRAVATKAPVMTRLGHLIDLLPGYAFASDEFSSDETRIRLLRGINVGVGSCRWEDTVFWSGDLDNRLQEYTLGLGDLVLGMDRPWIAEGTRVARVRTDDLPALLVQRVARIRAREGVCQLFVEFVLSSREFRAFLEADLTGVSVPHISEGQIASFRVPLLVEESQAELAREIERAVEDNDTLISDAERAIDLLQERRTALISAAVTGKIDVRGLVDAAEAA